MHPCTHTHTHTHRHTRTHTHAHTHTHTHTHVHTHSGATCLGNHVLVTDSSNFRVQAIPLGGGKVDTFASGLKWPLGIAAIGGGTRVLVTLDEGIVSLRPDGTVWCGNWSTQGDTGFLCQGGDRVFVASGGDGNIVSYNEACDGPDCEEMVVWNSTGSSVKAGSAIAYMTYPVVAPVPVGVEKDPRVS